MSSRPEGSVFEHRVDRFDAIIDWPRRLAREAPFYRRWFAGISARRVLDAACGTGHHAQMFHEWGLEVEAADVSPAMIAWCRQRYGQPAGLRWVERSFIQPADPPGQFDAVLCVGNSLALADSLQTVGAALAAMIASLRPGGVCIAHVLYIFTLPDGPTQWQKCIRTPFRAGFCEPGSSSGLCESGSPQPETDHILLKSIRRAGDKAFLDLVDLELTADGGVKQESQSESLLGLRPDDLAAAAAACTESITFFGNYQQEPYSPAASPDLILVCRRKR
jgi:SAM-dependent methyltransferase